MKQRFAITLITRCLLLLTILIIVGCSTVPERTAAPQKQVLPKVTQYALSLQGYPYRWGKASPSEGFDCSGFIQHVYKQQGVNLPRTAREMASDLPSVSEYDLKSGDLLFFNTNGNRYSHVGLYVNNDKFIHAPSRRSGKVHLSSLKQHYWRHRFSGARRPR
jgi:cell wall-associated NlpC family hydrolase